jgi:hypothetical protein
MKTASFFTYQGPGRISIARYAPRGISGFRIYHQLAPTRAMLKMEYAEYRELYFRDILGPLDPEQVWRDLHQLVHPHEPVLLCWEHPPLTEANWCHRRMVAEWFKDHLGPEVLELKI